MSTHSGPGPDYQPAELVLRKKRQRQGRIGWLLGATLLLILAASTIAVLRPTYQAMTLAGKAATALTEAEFENSVVVMQDGTVLRRDLRKRSFRRTELYSGGVVFVLRGIESFTYNAATRTLYKQKGAVMSKTPSEALLDVLEWAKAWENRHGVKLLNRPGEELVFAVTRGTDRVIVSIGKDALPVRVQHFLRLETAGKGDPESAVWEEVAMTRWNWTEPPNESFEPPLEATRVVDAVGGAERHEDPPGAEWSGEFDPTTRIDWCDRTGAVFLRADKSIGGSLFDLPVNGKKYRGRNVVVRSGVVAVLFHGLTPPVPPGTQFTIGSEYPVKRPIHGRFLPASCSFLPGYFHGPMTTDDHYISTQLNNSPSPDDAVDLQGKVEAVRKQIAMRRLLMWGNLEPESAVGHWLQVHNIYKAEGVTMAAQEALRCAQRDAPENAQGYPYSTLQQFLSAQGMPSTLKE